MKKKHALKEIMFLCLKYLVVVTVLRYLKYMHKLEKNHCFQAMKTHEFPLELINSKPYVAIVLTQSWCPQWTWMKVFLEKNERADTAIFYIEYDQEPFFQEFMAFKETVLKNDQVPYLRYYASGALIKTGNYTGQSGFESALYGTGNS